MIHRLIRPISLFLCFAVIAAVCPVPGVPQVAAATPIINENFTDGSIAGADLAGRYWTAETGICYPAAGFTGNLEVRTNPPRMKLTKSSNADEDASGMSFKVQKLFKSTTTSFHNDPRLTLRNEHFKGIYDIEYDIMLTMPESASGLTYFNVIGNKSDGSSGIIASVGGNPQGMHVLNNGANGGEAPSKILIDSDVNTRHVYRMRMDFTKTVDFPAQSQSSPAFQMYLDGNTTPVSASGDFSPADTFPMTNGDITGPRPSYMTGMWIGFQNQTPTNGSLYVNMYAFRMTEVEKQYDPTDDALALLTMDTVTDNAADVISDLKPLPDSFESVPGVSITWQSSNPDILSDEGKIVSRPQYDTTVILTATVQNTADLFTQYLDFEMNITGAANISSGEGTVLVDERYTNGTIQTEDLEDLGWSVLAGTSEGEYDCDPSNGSFEITSDPAAMVITRLGNNTGISSPMNYGVQKLFRIQTPSYSGNPRLTLRNEHFKGVYDVVYDAEFSLSNATGLTYLSAIGNTAGGKEAIVSQVAGGKSGIYVLNDNVNGSATSGRITVNDSSSGRHQ